MTEPEWLAATDPVPLLEFLRTGGTASERRMRLFTVACCRAVQDDQWPTSCLRVVDVVERYADGQATEETLHRARLRASRAAGEAIRLGSRGRSLHPSLKREGRIAFAANAAHRRALPDWGYGQFELDEEFRELSMPVFRDIFRSPFRLSLFDPQCRTPTAVALAQGIYNDRAFDRMPILADALEEAGCDDEDVLRHCRGYGQHVRGCWVVDRILDRE